jgi:primosomal protein N' (replication factor Y)
LKDLGLGVEKVAATLRTRFPSQTMEVLEAATFATRRSRQNLLQRLRKNQVDVLVGTYGVAKGLDDPRLGLTAVLNAEDWPGNIDYRFDERFLALIFQLAGRVNRPGSDQQGRCLIQTYDPVNPRWDFLLKEDWERAWQKFMEEDLATRKALNYPPFARFIKLSYKNKSSKKVEREVSRIQENINQAEPKSLWEISLLPGEPQKIKGGFFAQALLLKTAPHPQADPELSPLILSLKTGWSIDIGPENLFRP